MKQIPLTQGKFALVDDDDYKSLSRFKWYLSNFGYALRSVRIDGFKYEVGMHRVVMGLVKGDGLEVDHISCDPLDNRKENLRICQRGENTRNIRRHRDNQTGFKGVSLDKRRSTYTAAIMTSGKRYRVSGFDAPELAHEFYCLAADMLHGSFARHA